MSYTIENIYRLVGKTDQVATLTLQKGSEAYLTYGESLTVVFLYTQDEREAMDRLIQNGDSSTYGRIKAKELLFELSQDKNKQLSIDGINSEDIMAVFYLPLSLKSNTFHSSEKRVLNKQIIELDPLPNGGDLNWMYGFQKMRVQQGIGLPPYERCFYLAGKYYFEPNNLKAEELKEIFDQNSEMRVSVELEYLEMKRMRKEANPEDLLRLKTLTDEKIKVRLAILDNYLKQAGSSLKKLTTKNPEQAIELSIRVQDFNDRRLNIIGKHPIYMDIDSFLHIYMRHVHEFKINKHFEHKDNFQWNEEDVFPLMELIIKEIDKDYQVFRENNPELRFSKFGKESIYFQGDYYTFHVESTGRISTFHKNIKTHETRKK